MRQALLLLAALLGAEPAAAQDTAPPAALRVTAGATLLSDYRFRGLSQTGGDPAAQASVELDHVSGLYAGASGATIADTGRAPLLGGYGHAEVELHGGYARTLGGLTLDGGLRYETFPEARAGRATDYLEPYASLGYTLGPVAAKVGGAYAWAGQRGLSDGGDCADDSLYLYAEGALGVPATPLTLKAHVGRSAGALARLGSDVRDDRYWDWSLGAEASGGPLKVGVRYVDTDLPSSAPLRRTGGSTMLGYIGIGF